MKLSIIVPCKNEARNISELHKKISNALDKLKYEIIYVDDGSTDETLKELKQIYDEDVQHVKILSFSKNFKKDAAILAGIHHANGLYTCIMDSNLEHNPEYILDMYNYLEENEDCDIVAIKRNIKESKLILLTNKIIKKYCNIDMLEVCSEYRMFRTPVKEALVSLNEKNRFTKGIFSWIGFNYKNIDVNLSIEEKLDFKYYTNCAIDAIKSFALKPFSIAIKLGIFSVLVSLIYLIIVLVQILGFGYEMSAIYILIILVLLLFGIQFILMGTIGNYLASVSNEVKNRPIYIVKEKIGFSNETIL